MPELTEVGKEQLALALLLLKDFKCDGKFNVEVTVMILEMAKNLGVLKEYEKVMAKVPPMRIEPR